MTAGSADAARGEPFGADVAHGDGLGREIAPEAYHNAQFGRTRTQARARLPSGVVSCVVLTENAIPPNCLMGCNKAMAASFTSGAFLLCIGAARRSFDFLSSSVMIAPLWFLPMRVSASQSPTRLRLLASSMS